jgi:hypothetical protein
VRVVLLTMAFVLLLTGLFGTVARMT